MHLIICFFAKTLSRGPKCRDFIFDPTLNLFVWKSRRLTPEEFNAEAPKVFEQNREDLPIFAKAIFEKGDATETGQVIERDEMIKALTDKNQSAESLVQRLQGEIDRLTAEIGKPPAGTHPDEAKPRSESWHAERLAWQGEVETLRRHVTDLNEKLSGIAAKGPAETPFVRPGNPKEKK